jgi:hypothetical protein
MQVMPPSDGNRGTVSFGGRSYSCSVGSTITVPFQDGLTLLANGWVATSLGGSGTSAERPTTPPLGEFHDTTLGAIIRHDGKSWRDALTGAVV